MYCELWYCNIYVLTEVNCFSTSLTPHMDVSMSLHNEPFYKAHNTRQFVTREVIKIGLSESSLVPYSTGLEVLLGILRLEEQHKD